MRRRGVVARIVVLVLVAGLFAGCSEQVRRLQGQNQTLLDDRTKLQKQVDDLNTLLLQDKQRMDLLDERAVKGTGAAPSRGRASARPFPSGVGRSP